MITGTPQTTKFVARRWARATFPEGYGTDGVGMCVVGTCFGNYC